MRSGNGRHRRPRQVPALVVTAGVAGSALALPLFAASGANAAETTTWDRVAECESGGTWSADFGSGSYGGLQFTLEQWKSAGGLEFAARPDLASRSQQIAIAERVLASQGPQAWPLCGESSGLTRGGPAPTVDPGRAGSGSVAPSPLRPEGTPASGTGPLAGAPAPASTPASTGHIPGATTPSGASASPGALPAVPETPLTSGLPVMPPPAPETGGPATPTGPTGTPVAPVTGGSALPGGPTASPSNPAAPVAPTGPAATPGSAATPQGETSATGGKHRGTPAAETSAAPDALSDPSYTVKAGDNLTAIATAQGVEGGWNALYEANQQVIGHDADLITPGQNLDLSQK
ncbi:transglycosylase family protein [Streptomyces sp. NPDC006529]|uniref:LysM peptidoglycan-binding domain-containing protein n=1 Tax=Streptomyces sp. NPDC006529 TaxID=3157177 RepID=UPI0033B75149